MNMNSLSGLEPKLFARGRVHLYAGDGKDKTTAAAGLALRCLGHGGRVLFCQFLKGAHSGELAPLQKSGAVVRCAGCGRTFFSHLDENEQAALCANQQVCLERVDADARAGLFDLIVLDEVLDAVNCGALAESALTDLIAQRADHVELVLTGRNPGPELVEQADYYTELLCHSHPYKNGLAARRGIEL